MFVLIEGNIAAGKTTLGRLLQASGAFTFYPEPVEHWQGGFAANLLDRFYRDTQRWGFTLQICAFVTRSQVFDDLPPGQSLLFERSIYCDKHVFARNVYEQGFMDETEWALYLHFWDRFAPLVPTPDAILYLRTPASECMQRLQSRGRSEEQGVTLDYLQQLEQRHDEWLLSPTQAESPVIVLDGTQSWTAADIRVRLDEVALA